MQTLEGIRRSIETATELGSVVRTMKGIAAANIRQFEGAVESLGEYGRAVELGFQTLLETRPQRLVATAEADATRLGAVVFGSDQGMCGRFNQLAADHAASEIGRLGFGADRRTVLVVGSRIGPLLEMSGIETAGELAPATSLAGVSSLVADVLVRVEEWRSHGAADRVLLIYNEALGGASYRPRTEQLFPVDLEWLRSLEGREWPSRRLPMYTVEWETLFASLIREHFYIAIFRAAAESMASENASRLASMQAAERNIDERLEELGMRYRLRRQSSITEEILDIISGFEALGPADLSGVAAAKTEGGRRG